MAKRSLSFRLIKESLADPADALKGDHRLTEKPLADGPPNKRLFVGQAYSGPPAWLAFFNPADRAQFDGLYGGQPAAILFVSIVVPPDEGDGDPAIRWIAVCFGMAFQQLRSEALESQFGLRVALNRLGRERIKSIDTRRPEDATIQTRSQNSRIGEIFDFGVDTNHIILQAITGKSSDASFGGMVTGTDGLKLNCDASYASIDAKTSQILTAFASQVYQELFPWYGKITPVRDRAQRDSLDQELVRRLRHAEVDSIHLAPPEIIDYQNIDSFKFTGEGRGAGHDDLRLADYLALFDDEHRVTLAHLKGNKVKVAPEDGQFIDKWTVYKCMCAEIDQDGTLYVLAGEDWYGVVSDFVARINLEIGQIPEAVIALAHYQAGESEGDYNERAAAAHGLHLFDKALVQFQGERGRIEFCDLVSDQCQLVHVKKRSRSSLLSHLFLQGLVAAEAFIDYAPLRQQIRENIEAIQHLIPEEPPNPAEYEIVFALLHEGNATFPFFSKVALASIYRQLRRMNYRVGLAWVGTA